MWVIVTRETPGWSTLLGIGSVSAATLAAGVLLGWWLDGLLGTSPILVCIGIALGLAGGVCYTVVQFRPFLKD
jgi:F0F1-type ATP synthase assembly protein I